MKIKNFKINQKAVSKLAACVLVGSLAATTLTGCGGVDRNNLLKGTILENTCVVTFEDGSKDIAVAVGTCGDRDYHHYYSIISGEYFGSSKCTQSTIEGTVVHHYGITNEENITGYLTSDELTKAMQGEFDNNDLINIVSRTVNPITEETNTKILKQDN